MAQAHLTVNIDPELRRRVESAAQSRDTSVHEWIEEAVRRELEREETESDPFVRVSVPAFARDRDLDEDAVYAALGW